MLLHRTSPCIESRREVSTKPAENFLLIPLYGVGRKSSGHFRHILTRWNRLTTAPGDKNVGPDIWTNARAILLAGSVDGARRIELFNSPTAAHKYVAHNALTLLICG